MEKYYYDVVSFPVTPQKFQAVFFLFRTMFAPNFDPFLWLSKPGETWEKNYYEGSLNSF